MNENHPVTNNRGNHEINQRARLAEQFYQRCMQEEMQHTLKKTFSSQSTSWGAVFGVLFGSLLAKIRQPSVKKLNIHPDDWEKAHAR